MKQFLIENHHKIDETFHDRVVCIQDPDRFFLFGSGCGLEKNPEFRIPFFPERLVPDPANIRPDPKACHSLTDSLNH